MEKTKFTSIEEGVADALAYKIDSKYTTSDKGYFEVGSIALSFMSNAEGPKRTAEFLQNNEILTYIGVITGKTIPTGQDIEQTISWFDRARKGEDHNKILAEMEEYRANIHQ